MSLGCTIALRVLSHTVSAYLAHETGRARNDMEEALREARGEYEKMFDEEVQTLRETPDTIVLKAKRDTIVCVPRPDLIKAMNSGILSGKEWDWQTSDRVAFAEVVAVGRGHLWGPGSVPPCAVGDVIGFEQNQVQHVFNMQYRLPDDDSSVLLEHIMVPFKAVSCVIGLDGQTPDTIEATGAWVLTVEDYDGLVGLGTANSRIYQPGVAANGLAGFSESRVNMSVERVVNAGMGMWVDGGNGGYSAPDVEIGEFLCFHDVMSSQIRMNRQTYKLTPWSEAVASYS